ncbi:MAG: tetratricopeptide repeat protein [Lysobacter sp.]|nr:tetratricopeptide repeat protein [Lysobacter sp.]
MLDFPKDEDELESYLRVVAKLRDASNFQAALQACESLIDEPSTRAAGLRARADVYADMGQRESAVADREALVESASREPNDYFELGIALWRSGRLSEAASMFSRSLELGEQEDFHYYENASRMHLVALLIKLQRRAEALRECVLLPKNYSSYLPDGMTTREQLLENLSWGTETGDGFSKV